jgi:hypothetical protein
MKQIEEEKRDALPLLDSTTRTWVLDLQYRIPLLKLLAIEGAL